MFNGLTAQDSQQLTAKSQHNFSVFPCLGVCNTDDGHLSNFKATPTFRFQEVERELCRSLRHPGESTKQSGGISVTESRLQSFLLAAQRSHDCWPAPAASQAAQHSNQRFAYLGFTGFVSQTQCSEHHLILVFVTTQNVCVCVFCESKVPDKFSKAQQKVIHLPSRLPLASNTPSTPPEVKTSPPTAVFSTAQMAKLWLPWNITSVF